jgi:hypothetical protein
VSSEDIKLTIMPDVWEIYYINHKTKKIIWNDGRSEDLEAFRIANHLIKMDFDCKDNSYQGFGLTWPGRSIPVTEAYLGETRLVRRWTWKGRRWFAEEFVDLVKEEAGVSLNQLRESAAQEYRSARFWDDTSHRNYDLWQKWRGTPVSYRFGWVTRNIYKQCPLPQVRLLGR